MALAGLQPEGQVQRYFHSRQFMCVGLRAASLRGRPHHPGLDAVNVQRLRLLLSQQRRGDVGGGTAQCHGRHPAAQD